MRLSRFLSPYWLLPCSLLLPQGAAPAADPVAVAASYESMVKPLFQTHCVSCHGEKKAKGDLRVDNLPAEFLNFGNIAHWTEIMDRVNSGDMPPEDEPQPTPEEKAKLVEWIATQLKEADASRQSNKQRLTFSKLSREEYANTIRDLLGITYDAKDPTGLPDDPDWQGFERISHVLTISPAHVEKYIVAAETVLNEALALKPQPPTETTRWTAHSKRTHGEVSKNLLSNGLAEKVRADIVPNNGALDAYNFFVRNAGVYIVRVKLSGLRPQGGRAPRFRLYAANLGRVLYEQDIETAEDQPVTLEFRTHLPAGTHLMRIVNAVSGPNPEGRPSRPLNNKPFFRMTERQPWQLKLTDEDYKPAWPTLLMDWLEWEGPVQESWPPPAHQQIFFAGEGATKDLKYAREILTRFATRAYRRPVEPAEVDRLTALVDNALQLGDPFEAAVKTGLLAVLCSNNFLYMVEGSADESRPKLSDWELASRLSYFLWSTMPDQTLLDRAKNGNLHQPEILRAEVRRMLKDPKASAFLEGFPRQWLQLRHVGMFEPDKKIYPDYDDYLQKSMIDETLAFFREVFQKNLSLREFLDSDWTMLNERIAEHYGIPGVQGEPFTRVALKPEHHRGGLLTQASILSLTSDGTRHRPVHRGKWVLESIINRAPPPPPANVPAIETTAANQPKTSLREKIAAHIADPNCASCHKKIDPLGLAFENYDAIGQWRTTELVRDGSGANPKIDASGTLLDGRSFQDAAGLKKYLVDDLDQFAGAFTEKLATYALRRGIGFVDRGALQQISLQSKKKDYRLTDLIENLVLSDLFLSR